MDAENVPTPAAPVKEGSSSGKKKGKRKFRGKGSSEKHSEAHRDRINSETIAAHRAKVFGKTFGDADLEPLPEIRELEEPVERLVSQISASTRGIGFAVAVSYERALASFPVKVPQLCTVFQAYRASLLQAFLKVVTAYEERPKASLDPVDVDYVLTEELRQLIRGFPDSFSLVANVVSGLGWFEHSGCAFWPYIQCRLDRQGRVIPDPFCVLPSNLRSTAERMTVMARAAAREQFVRLNPWPGANYDAEFRLVNIDDVVPEDWPNRVSARRDLLAYQALLQFLANKSQRCVRSCDFRGKGSPHALVSRRALLGERVAVEGNDYIIQFHPDSQLYGVLPVSEQEAVRGGLSLVGEAIAPSRYRSPNIATWTRSFDWLFCADSVIRQTLR